ncbi:MAG: site-2 protease family protein [Legionellaceae bacterium]|nr:site-2 protease family protein [Legionellaceae bacterium]
MFTLTQQITAWILPVIFAITMHEAAHAYIANLCGDTTAKGLGRMSLNPVRHIDFVGTIIVPIAMAVLTQLHFIFGWAKPVPIDWNKLRNPRRDMFLVAIAGPGANFIMCFFWAVIIKLSTYSNPMSSNFGAFLFISGQAGVFINLVLGFINLIPIPPLDGSRVVASIIPQRYVRYYFSVERFGFLILVVLLVTGVLGWIVRPAILGGYHLIRVIFGF